ncbi:hypothetical protein R3W88_003485 [Solanum pinnatisectum]|uniref:Uncharacterized protein n=1 Tax=Solanum pinnatisectum TaxID=50273 RepID=A0AAV9MPR2_9SOLN|nr:hypothetical protein R3W88_003485 [Solanum pinnatisectum]
MAKLGIEIQIRKILKSSAPTPNHLRTLNLSLFDQLSPPVYVSILFNYLPSSICTVETSCNKLQKSLAHTLTKFYPLAGRILFRENDHQFLIHCNDQGIEYVETKVNADLAEFLHQGPNHAPLVDRLPKMDHRPSSPLLGVQVNVFNCGGLAMGIQISHIVADAFTLATFVNEWANTSLTGTTKDCLSSFSHLSSLFPTRVLSSGPKYSVPPPPNTTSVSKIVTRSDHSTKDKLNDFVNSVGNPIRDTCVAIGKAESVDDVFSLVVNNHKKAVDKYLQRDKMNVYPITSWCGFPWYEADFGWGKPFWVTSVSIDDYETIVVMDTKDGDGIQAWIEIQIQMRKMIKPSTPTPNHLRSLQLSFFDQGAPRLYVPILFHYLPTGECNRELGIIGKCENLHNSLAETLTKFYPLAGRFIEDEFSIHCNDEGVEYVESKVNSDLAEFLRQGPKIELLDDLLPEMDQSSSPLLGVQVNLFNCGGLVMGIQISHIVADAFTLATFVNEWANTSLTGTTKDCLQSFGPQFSLPSKQGPKITTKRFVFDALAIANLRNRINPSATFTCRPTRVVVVMSLIWKVLMGISSAKHGHSRDSSFLFPINLRGKSKLSSLEHAQGNFYVTVAATLEANEMRRELHEFVNSIGSTARNTSLSIADFGWGKPMWVSSVGKTFEVISLFDTKNGDGIEAWVSLKENDMIEFERDAQILASTSKAAFDS